MTQIQMFELYLLSQMRGQDQIEAAMASYKINHETVRQAAYLMGQELGFDHGGHRIDLYLRVLGKPIEIIPEPGIAPNQAFARSLQYRFHLPIWPTFDFIIRCHPSGWAWGPEIVRRHGAATPVVACCDDLKPWSLVVSEVCELFGPFDVLDEWNFAKDVSYIFERSGVRFEISLLFDFALLQRVSMTITG